MSIIGEATAVVGGLGKVWNLLRDRLDPARAQAKRLIETFEAYGIARQQIPRVLPSELALPNAAFSTADKLKDKLTPALLDWVAAYLAINRPWLDGVNPVLHLLINHYKSPAGYRDWLAHRIDVAPAVTRFVCIWKPKGQAVWPGCGPLCITYEETSVGLDAADFTRYWLLSDHWRLDHAPCVENLLAVIAVARSLDVWVLGYDVPEKLLVQLDAGKLLIPQLKRCRRGKWHPEDLLDPLPGQETDWRQALWQGAQGYLERNGVVLPYYTSADAEGAMKSACAHRSEAEKLATPHQPK